MPSTTTSIVGTTTKWSTELSYITREDLQAKLEEVFGPEGYNMEDYKIAVRFSMPVFHCGSLPRTLMDLC
jgi:hypothetical protein